MDLQEPLPVPLFTVRHMYVFRAPGAAGSEIVDWSEGDGERGGAGVEAAAAPDGGA